MAREEIETGTRLGALSWNLFHGRDFPPDRALLTLRSRLLRVSERDETHIQVNRDLLDEFAGLIAGWDWEVALLQECPPRWSERLARACDAETHRSLTARNSMPFVRRCLGALNPDLIASGEGGSNLLLVREGAGPIRERRELILQPGPRPERRTMAFAQLEGGLCVAGLHASVGIANRAAAEREVLAAAAAAAEWAEGSPLLFGGDFNLRPRDSNVFDELAARFGMTAPNAPGAIDHLLASNMEVLEAAKALPSDQRQVADRSGLAIRLSDHAPVLARFRASIPATAA
ncbi:hypothetical protein BH10ACT11_BH10ACT11_05020 [soil metagenome]